MRSARIVVGLMSLLPFMAAHAQAPGACDLESLRHQAKDTATIQHLEISWYNAVTHGDTDFERCLLSADFMSIFPGGRFRSLGDELHMTAKRKGQAPPAPKLPVYTVLLHGDVAVAYATWTPTESQMKPGVITDYFVWENGRWYVFFSQETPLVREDSGTESGFRFLP